MNLNPAHQSVKPETVDPQAVHGGAHNAARISGPLAAGVQPRQLGRFQGLLPFQPHGAAGAGLKAREDRFRCGVARDLTLVATVGALGRISDHSGTAVQIQLPGSADDLYPKTGCYGLCRV